jgi:hypothetical protein
MQKESPNHHNNHTSESSITFKKSGSSGPITEEPFPDEEIERLSALPSAERVAHGLILNAQDLQLYKSGLLTQHNDGGQS